MMILSDSLLAKLTEFESNRVSCWAQDIGVWISPGEIGKYWSERPIDGSASPLEILSWCRDNTKGAWHWDTEGVNILYWAFYFDLEDDLVSFLLRWK